MKRYANTIISTLIFVACLFASGGMAYVYDLTVRILPSVALWAGTASLLYLFGGLVTYMLLLYDKPFDR